jgi:uncharacterized protein (DUF433 family)
VPVPKKEANNLLQSRSMLVYNICMPMLKPNQSLPLAEWDDGSIRVADSRVPLDAIVHEFKLGATAEEILHSFPSLTLRDIYGSIFYYLNNTEQVEEYLRGRERRADEVRRFFDSRQDTRSLRQRILASRDQLATE